MSFYIRNISNNYAWILKNQIGPGETLNLNKVFEGFCKPKAATRGQAELNVKKFSEFRDDEFDEFMDWVKEEILLDKGKFEIIDDTTLPEPEPQSDHISKKRRAIAKAARPVGDVEIRGSKEALQAKRVTNKQLGKKLPSEKDMSPKEIAWLPADGMSRKIIEGIDDIRRLKTAFRLVRNISGQERTRKMIEDRIAELSSMGR